MPAIAVNRPIKFHQPAYNIAIKPETTHCHIDLFMKIPCINTRELPFTYTILKRRLPSILRCMCFNDGNIPFYEEVTHTEIGHLFEHILLEYLCIAKLAEGYVEATYSGNTSWNWVKESRGIFHIEIDLPFADRKFLSQALIKTQRLMTEILAASNEQQIAIL